MLTEYFKSIGMPINVSDHGVAIDHLIELLHWLMLVLFVGWGLFYIYLLVRFRASKQPKAIYEGTKSHASKWIEIAVVGAEVILLCFFSIPIWYHHVNAFPDVGPDTETTEIRVIAQTVRMEHPLSGSGWRIRQEQARADQRPDESDRPGS